MWCLFLMIRRPPRPTRTDTRFPHSPLFRFLAYIALRPAAGGCGPCLSPARRAARDPRPRARRCGADRCVRPALGRAAGTVRVYRMEPGVNREWAYVVEDAGKASAVSREEAVARHGQASDRKSTRLNSSH